MADTTSTTASDTSRTLRARLAGGIVQFTFTKVNGDERPATGTTDLRLVPEAFRPSADAATRARRPAHLITYFDFGAMDWRSCHEARVISIDD